MTAEEVRRTAESVPDPELPAVTIGNLGMVHDVRVGDDGTVEIEILPTFSGCPATDAIVEDVETAVGRLPGVGTITVRLRYDPPWTPERIDEEGRDRLRGFGITPPAEGGRLLPIAGRRPCPYCGSDQTETDSPFGPTPCRSIHWCASCRQPFEAFKAL